MTTAAAATDQQQRPSCDHEAEDEEELAKLDGLEFSPIFRCGYDEEEKEAADLAAISSASASPTAKNPEASSPESQCSSTSTVSEERPVKANGEASLGDLIGRSYVEDLDTHLGVPGVKESEILGVFDLFLLGYGRDGGRRQCLGQRPSDSAESIVWRSYAAAVRETIFLGSGLLELSLVPARNFPLEDYEPARTLRPLALWAANCPEWILCDMACAAYGLTLVPLYSNSGRHAARTILKLSEANTLVVDARAARSLLDLLEEEEKDHRDKQTPSLEKVSLEKPDPNKPHLERNDPDKPDSERTDPDKPDLDKPDLDKPDPEEPSLEKPSLEKPSMAASPPEAPSSAPAFAASAPPAPHPPSFSALRNVVTIEELSLDIRRSLESRGLRVLSLAEVLKAGRAAPRRRLQGARRREVHSICFTSGTTGEPKGILQTHGNVIAFFMGQRRALAGWERFSAAGGQWHRVFRRYYSYLPLVHIFDRLLVFSFLATGGAVAFNRGGVNAILPELKLVRPTLFVGVPRVFERVVHGALARGGRRLWALLALKRRLRRLLGLQVPGLEFCLSRARAAVGGEVMLCISAGAPLAAPTHETVEALLSAPLVEMFGLSETLGVCSTLPGDLCSAHVGGPTPGAEIRLRSALDYSAKDGAGELLLRGPSVSPGYFRRPEETRNAFTPEGWFASGDVARLGEDGRLRITDRVKHIFKLSQGEYVAPGKVEKLLAAAPSVEQIFVDGRSSAPWLVAVVVPAKKGLAENAVLAELTDLSRAAGAPGYEIVKAVHFSPEPFTVENGLLTPTEKLRRDALRKRFATDLDRLYSRLQAEDAEKRRRGPKPR